MVRSTSARSLAAQMAAIAAAGTGNSLRRRGLSPTALRLVSRDRAAIPIAEGGSHAQHQGHGCEGATRPGAERREGKGEQMSEHVKIVTDASFEADVLKSDVPV